MYGDGLMVRSVRYNASGVALKRLDMRCDGTTRQRELAGQVVDDREFLRQQQQDVGRADGIGFVRPGKPPLDVAHRVVAEVTDESPAEARQTGLRSRFEAG